jgi:hypothetical protein
MRTYSVTEAKAKLRPLTDLALKKRPIFIRRGQRMLQLIEATLPEPIPHCRAGLFAVGEERTEHLNSLPIDSSPLERGFERIHRPAGCISASGLFPNRR